VNQEAVSLVPRKAASVAIQSDLVPALIAGAGDQAAMRFVEFFTANIRNPHTRRAYHRAVLDFFSWAEGLGLSDLGRILPVHIAA
jgi:hypothetical protein